MVGQGHHTPSGAHAGMQLALQINCLWLLGMTFPSTEPKFERQNDLCPLYTIKWNSGSRY